MSRGREHCGVSQSAASQHVQEVERRLGMTLLDRSKRPLELTPAGKLYYDFCRDVLRREEEFTLRAGSAEGRCGRHGAGGVDLLDRAFGDEPAAGGIRGAVSRRRSLHVEYMRPEKIYEARARRQADLGLVSYPESSREICGDSVARGGDAGGGAAVAPSRAREARCYPADLERAGLHRLRRGSVDPARAGPLLPRAAASRSNLAMHFDNIQMIKEAVALGSGISILPARTMQAEIEQGRLVAVPLHAPDLVRPVGIVHRQAEEIQSGHRGAAGYAAGVARGLMGLTGTPI